MAQQVQAQALRGARVHKADEKPDTAVLELQTKQGSQFYTILRADLQKVAELLLRHAPATSGDLSALKDL